ncbi:hypothetical protein [Methylovulum psychrotolerans]|jgi:hypothetical protein|uniref:Uncharacterized protein n=1 Tax=Methylovulum psychrotolerans TaxID=1704499 RepID=A0A2S5CJA9_9GAMM|nr:hypothetical protein [Methylovulum psychrotolerans]POZ50890.1 hypothetical protein AADEFJLK_03362 [Methylovulum psychrotolerans]
MDYQYLNFGTRVIAIGSVKDDPPINLSAPFAVLLPAANKVECIEAGRRIVTFLAMGCIEFCCVGKAAEFLHDTIDEVIEDKAGFEVVTTYDLDATEGCEYFLFAAGGGSTDLLALVSEHPSLLNSLKNKIVS